MKIVKANCGASVKAHRNGKKFNNGGVASKTKPVSGRDELPDGYQQPQKTGFSSGGIAQAKDQAVQVEAKGKKTAAKQTTQAKEGKEEKVEARKGGYAKKKGKKC